MSRWRDASKGSREDALSIGCKVTSECCRGKGTYGGRCVGLGELLGGD